jgi:hypothetical protein
MPLLNVTRVLDTVVDQRHLSFWHDYEDQPWPVLRMDGQPVDCRIDC